MLNIAELVPPPESVQIPFDSAIHGIPSDSDQFRCDLTPGIPGIGLIWNQLKLQELRGIPGHQ